MLAKELQEAGYGVPHIIPDGNIHRFAAPDDKPGSKNCWIVAYPDGGGVFGSWKTGESFRVNPNGNSSEADQKLLEQIRASQKRRKTKIARDQKRTQEKARYLWGGGAETIIHPYPEKKRITAYGARQKDNRLLIPMYYQGKLWNVQQIQQDGTKRFLKGGRVKGCYMPIGELSEHIYICEGYATGCTLHQHLNKAVAVAFNAGNLEAVAKAIRAKHPDIQITIAADNDIHTKGNPGLTKARNAASAVEGDVIYPVFEPGQEGSDFNDYVAVGGVL